jgi:hypothetical protein
MNRRTKIIGGIAILVIGIWLISMAFGDSDDAASIKVPVRTGEFTVEVTTTGELKAKNSEDIKGPNGLRRVGIWNVKLTDLIPEGTIVKEGDYIASLDRTEIGTKLQDLGTELQKIESQYLQTKLDTSLELRQARDNLVNLKYAMEEAKITLAQSKFEPPATIRQAEIDSGKALRAFEQAKENYLIKARQSRAKMQEVAATLTSQQSKYDQMAALIDEFRIVAPKSGMLIYVREWDGKKKTVGSEIRTWNPVVATLPDLTRMVSKTYVNEVEIRKIKVGQEVKIGVDAFPEKQFIGKVFEVANIGEQRPNSDAKVFEVAVELVGSDTSLRPAMTTSNTIIASKVDSALSIPLEALHVTDSISFVYKPSGFRTVRQEVKSGPSNDTEVIIEAGLKSDDQVFLTVPADAAELKLILLNE